MKKIAVLFLSIFISSTLFAKEFNTDVVHSHVGFEIKHMDVSIFKGNFQKFNGVADIDLDTLKINKLVASVDVNSIYTANEARDNHLKNKDFFEVEKFPAITFEMTKFIQDNEDREDGKIEGYLTIKGIKKLVTLDSEIRGVLSDDGSGKQRVGISLDGDIDRFDFGIFYDETFLPGKLNVGKKVKFDIELELISK